MFKIEGDTIYLTRGDTGSFYITLTGHTFAAEDRALFTVKNGSGEIVLERVYPLAEAGGVNGRFRVDLHNPDTDYLATGAYSWDVRAVLHPYYDDVTGRIINGDAVVTPVDPRTLNLKAAVGEV